MLNKDIIKNQQELRNKQTNKILSATSHILQNPMIGLSPKDFYKNTVAVCKDKEDFGECMSKLKSYGIDCTGLRPVYDLDTLYQFAGSSGLKFICIGKFMENEILEHILSYLSGRVRPVMVDNTELDLCKSILKRLFHSESQLFDGTLYYSTGAGWRTCDHDQLRKDVKSVIGDYE